MDQLRLYFQQKYDDDDRVRCVSLVHFGEPSPLLDNFDFLVLVVTERKEPYNYISHYIKEPYRIQERWMHKEGIQSWVLNGENRNIIQWILQGEILLDKDSFLRQLQSELVDFSEDLKHKKLFMEFSLFLRNYLQCKTYLTDGHNLDAYSSILKALVHWARISIIESGNHPEVTVWEQLRKINPGIYKLYEELTQSLEPLDKRVELVRLACEFSVMTKMKDCCRVLIQVLESRKAPWSAIELKEHPDLRDLHVEMTLLLKKLAKKSIVREVAVPIDEKLTLLELRYTC